MIDESKIISIVNKPEFWYRCFGSAYITQKELEQIKQQQSKSEIKEDN